MSSNTTPYKQEWHENAFNRQTHFLRRHVASPQSLGAKGPLGSETSSSFAKPIAFGYLKENDLSKFDLASNRIIKNTTRGGNWLTVCNQVSVSYTQRFCSGERTKRERIAALMLRSCDLDMVLPFPAVYAERLKSGIDRGIYYLLEIETLETELYRWPRLLTENYSPSALQRSLRQLSK